MANNVAVSITADVADFTVKMAQARSDVTVTSKSLNDLVKAARQGDLTAEMRASLLAAGSEAAKATNTLKMYQRELAAMREATIKNAEAQHAASGMSAQNSAALKNLSFQINDVATGLATGQPAMMIFAQQGSQIVQALQMMEGGGNKVIGFLSGPWGMALTAATVVVAPFIAKLIEAKTAAEENAAALEQVKLGDTGLSDAQNVLGKMFDLTTGKLKEQNEMLRLNARLVAQRLRAEGMADADQARKIKGDIGHNGLLDFGPRRITLPALQRIEEQRASGKMTNEEAMVAARKLNFSGTGINAAQYNEMLIKGDEAKLKQQMADRIDKSLDTGKLDDGLKKTDKKKGSGPDIVSVWAEQLHAQEIASGEFFKDQTAKELTFWQGKVNLTKAGSKERLAVEGHIYDASRQLAQQDYQNQLATLNDKIEADRNNWALVQADWAKKLALIKSTFGEQSSEYQTAHRDLEKLEREHQDREMQAAQQHATRLIEQYQRQMDARVRASNESAKGKDAKARSNAGLSMFGDVGAEVAISQNHQSAIAEQMAASQEFYQQQTAELNKQIAAAQAVYGDDKTKYQGLLDAKEQATQKFYERQAALEAQSRDQSLQSIQAIKAAFHGYLDGVVSSGVTAFDGLISGQKSWAQAGISIYQSVVQQAERRFAQMVSNWIVDHASMKAVAAVTAQADATSHAAAEGVKTGATTAGVTARAGIETSAQLAVSPVLAAAVAQHSAAEAAKTGATAVGTASRVATTAAGATTTAAITTKSNLKEITSHAAAAAAGAYKAMASIPIVGPVLGALAAAATFTAVEAYGALASFDKGTNVLPTDMVAQIHAGERIVPKADNERLIALTARGAGMGGGDQRAGDMHVTYAPTINGQLPFGDQLDAHEGNIISMLQRAHRRGALNFAR